MTSLDPDVQPAAFRAMVEDHPAGPASTSSRAVVAPVCHAIDTGKSPTRRAPPAGGSGGSSGGFVPPDFNAPDIDAYGSERQRLARRGALQLRYESSEDCSVVLRGTVLAGGRRLTLRSVRATLRAGQATRLELRVADSTRRAIRAALQRGRHVRAIVRLTAKDAAGNAKTYRFRVAVVG